MAPGLVSCQCDQGVCECQTDVFKPERERIVRFLIEEKGYRPEEIKLLVPLTVEIPGKRLHTKADIVVELEGRPAICIRLHEGSVVSRERGTIAAARLLNPEAPPPICVQTNGQEYSILDTYTKKSLGERLEDLPSREEMLKILREKPPRPLSPKQIEAEQKILFFYDGIG
ncbi:MAG: type I restriction enzyme HsdR N-terminal domain-containing protein [Thermodesulfobacteria bacterium]|nr:type I restriction enzyme HsdR N-terminal domain-containing protein [Thermodesulfobacteriota bacterium]